MKVVILGDSVTWGQGLLNHQKFHTLALQEIAATLGLNANNFVIQNSAHSGAIIDKRTAARPLNQMVQFWQEVPHSAPTIWQQIPDVSDPDVKLVMLDGGINDVNFLNIISPTTTKKELDRKIERYCYQGMVDLLTKVRRIYPNAFIIVTGYYPILSEKTPLIMLSLVVSLLSAGGLALFGAGGTLVPHVIGLATLATAKRVTNIVHYFAKRQLYWLRRAVQEKYSTPRDRGPGLIFVHPAFGANNAIGAPSEFLFSPHIRGDIEDIWTRFRNDPLDLVAWVDSPDPVVSQREAACAKLDSNFSSVDKVKCALAGIGHPNQAGARRYASIMARNHREYVRISVRTILESVHKNDSSLSLRRIMRRYDFLAHNFRFKKFHQHLHIDCLSVRIKTKDRDFAGTDQTVKLRVGRGREWTLNESIFQGDDVDEFERGDVNEYTIDPARGNPNNRLHLSELKEITLILEPDVSLTDVDLGAWMPESIQLSINGQVVFRSRISKTLYAVAIGDFDNRWTAKNFP